MKKKKALIMLLLAALFVTAMPAVTLPMEVHAVSDPGSCPGHHWVEKDSFPATCVNSGQTTYQCSICGGWKSENHAPTGQHTWGPVPGSTQAPGADGWITEAEATCTAGGRQFRNCTQCGFREDRTTNALGHAYDGGTVTKEATCTEAGVKTFKCTRCNESRTEAIAATGHNYQTAVTKEATCTEEGEKETKCSKCGDTKKEVIPKIAHNYQTTVTKEATCKEEGEKETKCTLCGETKKEAIPKIAHQYQEAVTKEATCTVDGTKTTKCTLCGETKTEAIPKLGHNYQETVTKQPTCTEEGEKQTKCTRCNDTKTEKIAALGHDWDRSATVQPEGFTDGEAHATCRRCGEEETQTLSAGTALFNRLRNTDPNLANKQENAEELRIVYQSDADMDVEYNWNGGAILEVGVEGGVAPYSYEWHAVLHNAVNLGRPLTSWSALQNSGRISSAKASAMNKYRAGGKRGTRKARQRSGSTGATLGRGRDIVVSTEGATYVASEGERDYYCVITDAAGNRVESDPVSFYYYPYISRQPEDVNLFYGPTEVSVGISGGRPGQSYLYEWRDAEGNILNNPLEEDPSFTIDREGEYHCEILVDTLAEPLVSDTILAYNMEPLKLWVESEEIEWEPEEGEREIGFYYRGGTAPYTIQYFVNGVLRGEDTITEKEWDGMDAAVYDVRLSAYETEQDTYAIAVTDANGETQIAYTVIVPYKLEIEEEPEHGMLGKNGESVYLEVSLYDSVGDAPFTYILYLANKEIVRTTSGDLTCGFNVREPGYYYFRIEDANGRYVYSDTAMVSPYETTLEIESHTESGKIYSKTAPCALSTYVKGGTAPYTYQWQILPYGEAEDAGMLWRDIDRDTDQSGVDTFFASEPGTYRCIVSDRNGETERTENISVTWAGTGIHIVHEPEDVLLDYREDDAYSAGMYCNAASGSGDDDGLRYRWEKKRSNGLWQSSGSGQTLWKKSSAEEVCGVYRCKVYDTKTGTTTYSREVKVDVKLSVEITGFAPSMGYIPESYGYMSNVLYYRLSGGEGPYNVEVYERQKWWDPQLSMLAEKEYCPVNFTLDQANGEHHVVNPLEYTYYIVEPYGIQSRTALAECMIRVTDARGQVAESQWFNRETDTALLRDDYRNPRPR